MLHTVNATSGAASRQPVLLQAMALTCAFFYLNRLCLIM